MASTEDNFSGDATQMLKKWESLVTPVLIPFANDPLFPLGEAFAVAVLLIDAAVLLLVAAEAPVECDSHTPLLLCGS